jgi:hypothetical protein
MSIITEGRSVLTARCEHFERHQIKRLKDIRRMHYESNDVNPYTDKKFDDYSSNVRQTVIQ